MPSFREARVAFVILTWNSSGCIEACLDSVFALEARRLDVYVVDNGSADETPGILRSLQGEHGNLHVFFEQENLGTTRSRNKALRAVPSDTDFICILDSDTVVNQNAMDMLARVLADERNVGVVGPLMRGSDGSLQLSGRNLPTLGIKLGKAFPVKSVRDTAARAEIPEGPSCDGVRDVGYLLSACWLMPYATYESVGALDERIFYAPEDVDWCLRVHRAGMRVVLCDRAEIIHEYQRLSHKKLFSKTNVEHIKGLAHYFRKHGYLFRAPRFDR